MVAISALLHVALWPACLAEVVFGGQHYASFNAFYDRSDAGSGHFSPVHIRFETGCIVNTSGVLDHTNTGADTAGLAAIVVWEEASDAGCFTFAQVAQHLQNLTETANTAFQAIVFGSAVANNNAAFGSPIVEPYGDLQSATSDGLRATLLSASSARYLAQTLDRRNATQGVYINLYRESGPWNTLVGSVGFKAHRYLFLAISIGFILYTFWEIGLMLCTLTVWNRRMLMYLSAIGYLVVFTLLQPYNMNSRAAEMAIYLSWIAGYTSLSLFIVAWGTTVQNIHAQDRLVILKHHYIIHYGAAAVVSLSILVKLWAFAAESYQFAAIANSIVAYELPVVFGVQTILLGMLISSFLSRTFGIAISKHTKTVLRNVAMLCIISLFGCLCMFTLGVVVISPARYTTIGYQTVIIIYELGQCLLFVAIFGALWVRDHAKRTRPLFHQHEFYAENRMPSLQPLAVTTGAQSGYSNSTNSDTADPDAIPFSQHNSRRLSMPCDLSVTTHLGNTCQNSPLPGTLREMENSVDGQHSECFKPSKRKASQKHVYIPLEYVSTWKSKK